MELQLIVAALNHTDHSILEKMNIQCDAIIANQCDKNEIENISYFGHRILFMTFNERGVGLNRNNAIMRATADICILADEDMRFSDGYVEVVKKAFSEYPSADVIIFNFIGNDRYKSNSVIKVNYMNYMKYGAARIAFRRKKISYAGIYFNQNFGGGTEHSCGEDTIFLHDCLQAGLKIIHIPYAIAELDSDSESTWFRGYNEKFFYDRGVLHTVICKKMFRYKWVINLFNYIYLIRHKSLLSEEMTFDMARKIMNKSIDYYLLL